MYYRHVEVRGKMEEKKIRELEEEINRLWEAIKILGEQMNDLEFKISENIADYLYKVVS